MESVNGLIAVSPFEKIDFRPTVSKGVGRPTVRNVLVRTKVLAGYAAPESNGLYYLAGDYVYVRAESLADPRLGQVYETPMGPAVFVPANGVVLVQRSDEVAEEGPAPSPVR